MGGLFITETVFFPRFLTRGSIRAPPLSRPVAPQSASYRDVVASPRRRKSCAVKGRECWRGGVGTRAQRPEPAGAGAGASGPNSPRMRLGGGARLQVCNARAPRRVCVSPRSPSFPASPRVRLSPSGRQSPAAPSGSPAWRSLAVARPEVAGEGAAGSRGWGAGDRAGRAGVTAGLGESRLRGSGPSSGSCRPRPLAA